MKILMLVDYLNIGGTETHILSISKDLLAKGQKVILATEGGELANLFEEHGIETFFIKFEEKELINLIKNHKVNIVHCHLGKSMNLCRKIHDIINMPYIITLHGMFYSADELNYTCSKASHIIAVSNPVKNMLFNCMNEDIESKVSVLYNTFDLYKYTNLNTDIDIRKSLNIKENEKIVVYCSRLSFSKGKLAEKFIHAFYEVAKDIDNIHAIVIGDGPKKIQLEFYKNSLNARLNKECIHIIGSAKNVIPYYLESMFVVGSARVAIEAMSCSKPVIAMGLMSTEGLINDKNAKDMINCYFGDHDLINPKDISNLIFTMKYLLNNENECIELGKWSKKWCFENFNNDKSTNLLIAIYIKHGIF